MNKQQKPISEEEYRRHVAMASGTGNYFTFRECYLDIMSPLAALVLQKLVNKYSYLLRKGKLRKDERITCTVAYLEDKLRLKADCQQRVLKELAGCDTSGKLHEDRAFFTLSKAGVPPRRMVYIDFLKLNRALDWVADPNNGKYPSLQKPRGNSKGSNFPNTGNSPPLNKGKSRDSYKYNKQGNKEDRGERSAPHPPDSFHSTNGHGGNGKKEANCRSAESQPIKPKKEETSNCRSPKGTASMLNGKGPADFAAWSDRLHKAAEERSGRIIKYDRKIWVNSWVGVFRRTKSISRLENALDHYCTNEIINRNGRPLVIRQPKQFENCLDWIEDDIAHREQKMAESKGEGRKIVRLLVGKIVWEKKPNGTRTSRQVCEEVTRRRRGEWVEGDRGRYWDGEPLENLLNDGESLIREIR